jgi:hypothetical protein
MNQRQSVAIILPRRGNHFSLSSGERAGVRAVFLDTTFAPEIHGKVSGTEGRRDDQNEHGRKEAENFLTAKADDRHQREIREKDSVFSHKRTQRTQRG